MYASGITFTGVASVSAPPTTVVGANNGLSISTITPNVAVLGENLHSGPHPALIFTDRQIPISPANVLKIGINAQGGIQFQPQAIDVLDITNHTVLFIIPPNNQTLVGLPGQNAADIRTKDTFNYTNPAGTGVVACVLNQNTYNFSDGAIEAAGFIDNGFWNSSGGIGDYVSFLAQSVATQSGLSTGNFRGLYVQQSISGVLIGKHIAIENTDGDVYLNSNSGKTGVQQITTPTAFLHIGPTLGGSGPGNAPLKFTAGTRLAIAEAGAFEYDGNQLYFTRVAATREDVLTGNDGAAAPATTPGIVITNFFGTSATNFLGTPVSWASVQINGTVYKIPLYT